MPTLIVSSRFSTDSQLLRSAARQRGWETIRLDGWQIPEWFDPPDDQFAMFYTAPSAFDVADQLSRCLLGCHPQWATEIPQNFLQRELRPTTLGEALRLPDESFVKHSVSKAFPSAVYTCETLTAATSEIPLGALVHVGEVVNWIVEYRCFVRSRTVAAISVYRRHGQIIEDHTHLLGAPQSEIDAAQSFAETVLASAKIDCPDAFVLDVGMIDGRGWAVIECNECWASGIYACDPHGVLDVLLHSCVPETKIDRRWDFKQHYFAACADGRQ